MVTQLPFTLACLFPNPELHCDPRPLFLHLVIGFPSEDGIFGIGSMQGHIWGRISGGNGFAWCREPVIDLDLEDLGNQINNEPSLMHCQAHDLQPLEGSHCILKPHAVLG